MITRHQVTRQWRRHPLRTMTVLVLLALLASNVALEEGSATAANFFTGAALGITALAGISALLFLLLRRPLTKLTRVARRALNTPPK